MKSSERKKKCNTNNFGETGKQHFEMVWALSMEDNRWPKQIMTWSLEGR
jgi:hypothetical protein